MRRRFDEIDVMRAIGFLMVVDQHILGSYAQRAETNFADSMVFKMFSAKHISLILCYLISYLPLSEYIIGLREGQ